MWTTAGLRIFGDPGRLPGMSMTDDANGASLDGLVLGGRYRLQRQIGAGGMAVVWRAHDDVLGRAVAVKVVAPALAWDIRSRERIRHEARAAAALSHPNVAQVHDYGEMDRSGRVFPYVVMELVHGGTLLARLSAGLPPPEFAMRIAAEIAAALAAAHAEGLVHRDIKPGNVMLAPTGAKVVDFGIAAAISPGGLEEPEDDVLGTPAYLAPERLIGDAVVPASDVYALGVVLYRMLSGRSPWSSEDTRQMVEAHLYVPPARLPPIPGVPDYVIRLVDRCLAKDPAQRPAAEEAAEVLARGAGIRVVNDEPTVPVAAPADPTVLVRRRRAVHRATPGAGDGPAAGTTRDPAPARGTRWRPAVAVVVMLLVAGVGVWALAGRPERSGARDGVAAGEPVPPPRSAPASAGSTGGADPIRSRPAPVGEEPATRTVAPGAGVISPGPGVATPAPTTTTPGATEPGAATPTTTAPPPAAVERTFSSAGGKVVATCPSPGTAELLSWTATRPYKLDSVDPGPAVAPAVTFRQGNRAVTMTVTCDAGVPESEVA
jgi:hypothetical protein